MPNQKSEMLIDYHLHNHFSPDSDALTDELLAAEKKNGVTHICFCNHAETFHRKEEHPGTFDLKEATERFSKAKEEIEAARPRFPELDIRFGAEAQYQEQYLKDLGQFLKKMPFDFVLGSVHIIDGTLISGGRHAHEVYQRMTEEDAYGEYFDTLLKLVEWGQISAVAHFDICKKFGHQFYGPFQPEKYKPVILKILKTMKKKGIGIEVNVGSLHKNCHEPFPHPLILKWCAEVGIKFFTLGSDAHEVARAGAYIPEALEIAKAAGITHLSTYKNRIPTKHKILDV